MGKREKKDRTYSNLWTEKRFTDAEVLCEDLRLPVHRAVLCSRSQPFAFLFEGRGKEAASAQVDLSGEDPSAVSSLIEHIYTGKLPKDTDPVLLLPLADRFEVFDCVDDCAKALEKVAQKNPAKA